MIFSRVAVAGPDDCWRWNGAMKGGSEYGQFTHRGRRYYAHREAFKLRKGPLADGMDVLHRCDNPACCNPTHLFAGTHADNMADMLSKGRKAGPQYKLRGVNHPAARLTEQNVRDIRKLLVRGVPRREIQGRYKISKPTVQAIAVRRLWKHM